MLSNRIGVGECSCNRLLAVYNSDDTEESMTSVRSQSHCHAFVLLPLTDSVSTVHQPLCPFNQPLLSFSPSTVFVSVTVASFLLTSVWHQVRLSQTAAVQELSTQMQLNQLLGLLCALLAALFLYCRNAIDSSIFRSGKQCAVDQTERVQQHPVTPTGHSVTQYALF